MGDAVAKPADADTPAQSFPERLMGIFISPAETLADVARKPDFVAPLIAIVLGPIAVTETMLWKIGMERIVRTSIEQSGRASSMSPEQMDQAVRQGARIGAVFAHISGVVGAPIFLLILAGLGLLIVNLIFGAKTKFKTVFSLVCYAKLVTLLGALMALAVILFGDPDHFNAQNPVPANVGFFLNPLAVSKPLYALVSSADIFTIWFLILAAVGLAEGAEHKVKPLSIFLVYAGFWMIWILVGMVVIFAALYVYISLALQTIAKKTNTENPWLAWIPIANVFLMLNIAKEPLWWFILCLIPFVNIVVLIIVCMAIAEARGKPSWWGILYIVPVANLIVPGYLAWAD
jgi:hypothetical protein